MISRTSITLLLTAIIAAPASADLVGCPTGDTVSDTCYSIPIEGIPDTAVKDNPPLLPGWPITIAGSEPYWPIDNPTLVDLDYDGDLEIIVSSPAGVIYVWTYDGNPFPGWPRPAMPGGYISSGPAAGDIDGDASLEIVLHTRGTSGTGGRICAWETDGSVISGFPVNVGNWNPRSSASLRDMDDDGGLDLIAGFKENLQGQLYIIEGDGSLWDGFPVVLDHVPSHTAATGDLDGDGDLEFVYASYETLYAFEADGTIMPGWPFTPSGYRFYSSSAALHDFDGDGDLEICCPADGKYGKDARMYVFHHDGTVASGWPVTLNNKSCGGSPSLGDVDGDGEIEIVIGDDNTTVPENATLYCWNFDGSNVSGWPVDVPHSFQIVCNPVIADLDGDGYVEIAVTSSLVDYKVGYFHGYNHDGTVMDGWPIRVDGWTAYNSGAVGDVDNDGDIDLCTVSWIESDININLWDLSAAWDPDLAYWPMFHHDMWHTGDLSIDVSTSIDDEDIAVPNILTGFMLYQSYPNPSKGTATISFALPETVNVRLDIYDIKGCKVANLIDETFMEGEYEHSISGLTSGIYLCRLEAGDFATTEKMVVIK